MLDVLLLIVGAVSGFGMGVIIAPEFYRDPRLWEPPPCGREDE
jgi:hypothetical protein